MVNSEVGMVAGDRHIKARERSIDSIRALQLRRNSLRERGSTDAEAFFHGDGVRRGRERHNASCRAYFCCARVVREVCMNPSISPSLPSFCNLLIQPAASRELLEYSQSFPRARDGHFCQAVQLRTNSSALQEHSNPPQTCPESSQYL